MTNGLVAIDRPRRQGAAKSDCIPLVALRAPLLVKLIGANILVIAVCVAGWLWAGCPLNATATCAAGAALVIHWALVSVALQPINELETVANCVWRGDFAARVARSNVADHEVLRIGSMFNLLLDGLELERSQMRRLAEELIRTGDRERAAVAKELHDSTAQQIAALILQLAAVARAEKNGGLAGRLEEARDAAVGILEQVRQLSQTVHSSVLSDLGLAPALRKLGRDLSTGNSIDVDVNVFDDAERLPLAVESALYRVAYEAMQNAVRHGNPRHLRVNLYREESSARLEIHDDGSGFDGALVERAGSGTGLLRMRERLLLVEGSLEVRTARGHGCTIAAAVPFSIRNDARQLEQE